MRTINAPIDSAEASTSAAPPAASTAPDTLVDSIVEELHQMIGSLRCAGTGRMVKAGISMTHLHILWVLEHHGELPMSRLADLLDVSLSNATGLIDRMEERGLVERLRVPDDRRVVIVRASEQGVRIRDEIEALKQDRMCSPHSATSGAPSSTRSAPITLTPTPTTTDPPQIANGRSPAALIRPQ
jgi:DNA-binding MarR family transcriptional regulator